MVDLGFAGDVYVVGLSLEEVELKIAQQLTASAVAKVRRVSQPYKVSARLTNPQSKYYYVMGTVAHPGEIPHQGERDGPRRDPPGRLEVEQPSRESLPGPASSPGEYDQVLKIDWCGIREARAILSPITSSSPATGSSSRGPNPPA